MGHHNKRNENLCRCGNVTWRKLMIFKEALFLMSLCL